MAHMSSGEAKNEEEPENEMETGLIHALHPSGNEYSEYPTLNIMEP